MSAVPFLDLGRIHAPLKSAILADLDALISSSAFANGPQVAAFEQEFASYCEAPHAVGVASGLDALRLGLLALGVGPDDEVIVPANTFVATLEAVSQCGARPVVVDMQLSDYNIDPAAVEDAITSRTRALLPVHLYGQLADMRELAAIAKRHGLAIVEDAAQAHGATRDGIRAGTAGAAAAFSFYPGKNLGAMGDAGALTSSDPDLVAAVRALREHGQSAKYHHDVPGYTARLDTAQAIVLSHKLPLLDGWNHERRQAAAFYADELSGVGDLTLPPVAAASEPVWHLYPIATERRSELEAFLGERQIGCGRHYPVPVHLTDAYESLGQGPGSCPVAESLADRLLSLPIFPGMTEAELASVASAVRDFFA